MLTALLGDTFFYASSGGLLVSAIAFPFILKRFRAIPSSSASLDIPSDLREPPEFVEPAEPVEPVKVVESEPDPEPEEAPKPEPTLAEAEAPVKTVPPPEAAAEPKKINPSVTLTSGLSPAIVYLQNLKIQIEHFEKEIHQLRGQILGFAKKHDEQFDDIVKRMGDMQAEFHQQMHSQVEHQASRAVAAASAPVPEFQAPPEPVIAMKEEAPKAQAPAVSVQIEEMAPLSPAPQASPESAQHGGASAPAAAVVIENTVALAEPVVPVAEPTMPIQIAPETAGPAATPARDAAEDIAQSLTLSVPGQSAAESKPAETAEGEDDILKPRAKGPVWPV